METEKAFMKAYRENLHVNNCNMADTNSKYTGSQRWIMIHIAVIVVTKRISKFLIWTKKKNYNLHVKVTHTWYDHILWTNIMSTKTVFIKICSDSNHPSLHHFWLINQSFLCSTNMHRALFLKNLILFFGWGACRDLGPLTRHWTCVLYIATAKP